MEKQDPKASAKDYGKEPWWRSFFLYRKALNNGAPGPVDRAEGYSAPKLAGYENDIRENHPKVWQELTDLREKMSGILSQYSTGNEVILDALQKAHQELSAAQSEQDEEREKRAQLKLSEIMVLVARKNIELMGLEDFRVQMKPPDITEPSNDQGGWQMLMDSFKVVWVRSSDLSDKKDVEMVDLSMAELIGLGLDKLAIKHGEEKWKNRQLFADGKVIGRIENGVLLLDSVSFKEQLKWQLIGATPKERLLTLYKFDEYWELLWENYKGIESVKTDRQKFETHIQEFFSRLPYQHGAESKINTDVAVEELWKKLKEERGEDYEPYRSRITLVS